MLFSYLQDELKKKKAAEKLKRKNYEIESLKKVILQFVCFVFYFNCYCSDFKCYCLKCELHHATLNTEPTTFEANITLGAFY